MLYDIDPLTGQVVCAPSGGGGNATVPEDAPIQPPQAFVDVFSDPEVFSDANSNGLWDFSNHGITYIRDTDAFLYPLAALANYSYGSARFNFSENALPVENVDAILAKLGSIGFSNGVLNLSGGTNAEPTLDVPSSEAMFTLDANEPSLYADLAFGGLMEIWVKAEVELVFADSTLDGNYLTIGTSDSPSAEAVAAKIVELWPSPNMVTADGSIVTGVVPSEEYSPVVDNQGYSQGLNIINSGGKATSASIMTLVANGWTVTININGVPTTFSP